MSRGRDAAPGDRGGVGPDDFRRDGGDQAGAGDGIRPTELTLAEINRRLRAAGCKPLTFTDIGLDLLD